MAYGTWALRVYGAGMFAIGMQHACQQSFVALGQAKISLFLALLRKFILLIPLIFILPHFFANQVFAVFLAEPVADIWPPRPRERCFSAAFKRSLPPGKRP